MDQVFLFYFHFSWCAYQILRNTVLTCIYCRRTILVIRLLHSWHLLWHLLSVQVINFMKNAFPFLADESTEAILSLDMLPIAMKLDGRNPIHANRHAQGHYEIIWIQEGSGAHSINQTYYQLLPGRVYCTMPGQTHQLQIDTGSKGYIIAFSESFLSRHYHLYSSLQEEKLFHQLIQNPALPIDDNIAEDMQHILPLLVKETNNKMALSSELAIQYLRIFLLYLRRQLQAIPPTVSLPKNNGLLRKFQWLLENNFREKKAVAQYAKDLFVTPNHLNHVLRESTGFSARQLIQQRIIREAKKKACEKGTSMKEIAYDLGFTDIAHFSKYFKNTSGINFRSFKNETISHAVTVN